MTTRISPLTNDQRRVLNALYERDRDRFEIAELFREDSVAAAESMMRPLLHRGLVRKVIVRGKSLWRAA